MITDRSGIFEPVVGPIDIRCSVSKCVCSTSVPGNQFRDGDKIFYDVVASLGPICNICRHLYKDHDKLGLSLSEDERRQI